MKSRTLLRSRGHATAIVAYRNRRAETLLAYASRAFADGLDSEALEMAHESGEWRNPVMYGSIGRNHGSRPPKRVRWARQEDRNHEATTN